MRYGEKSPAEKMDEEADRRVRPSPKDKPPRHDKRRERINEGDDPDLDMSDPDLSMNYKDIGGSVLGMNGFPDPPKLPQLQKLPKLDPLPKPPVPPKPPHLPPEPKPRPPQEDVNRVDYSQEFWEKVTPYLHDLVRGDHSFLDYLKSRLEEPKRKSTDLLVIRDPKIPPYIKTYGHLREWVQQAGGVPTLEKSVALPSNKSARDPIPSSSVQQQPVQEAVVHEPLPIYFEPLRRPLPTYEDKKRAVQTLVKTLRPNVAVQYASHHPEDLLTLLSSYMAYFSAKKGSFSFSPPPWLHYNPLAVTPWTGLVMTAGGLHLPIRLLSEQEQREFQQNHRYRVVGASLAWRDLWSHHMKKVACVPPTLLRSFEAAYGGKSDLRSLFVTGSREKIHPLPQGWEFLHSMTHLGFKEALLAYYRGRVLSDLDTRYLKATKGAISEHDHPRVIASKILKAWEEAEKFPLDSPTQEPLGLVFARKVLRGLRRYSPEKLKPVLGFLGEKREIVSFLDLPQSGTSLRWIEDLESSYAEGNSNSSMPPTPRTALYHGVEPKRDAYPYPTWEQGRVWEITPSVEDSILKEARSHRSSPNVKGMEPDAASRAALDYALKTYEGGKYHGGIPPQMYNSLLAKLMGQSDDPLLTLREAHTMSKSVKSSQALRSLSSKISSGDVTAEEAAMDLVFIADQIQEQEQAKSDTVQAQQQEQQAPAVQAQQQEQQAVQAYAALRSSLIRLASSSAEAKAVLLPILRTLKGLPVMIPKQAANDVLERLERTATYIETNAAKWGIPTKVAQALVLDLDKASDTVEVLAFGEDSLAKRQVAVVAKVIQKESDEPYMGTFDNPMKPILTNSDEPYMQAYADDQSSAVINGKSSTGVPLAPLGKPLHGYRLLVSSPGFSPRGLCPKGRLRPGWVVSLHG